MEGVYIMKKLYNLNIEPLIEGGTLYDGTIMINIELLWDYTNNEMKFIKEFSNVLIHEMIHNCCREVIPNAKRYPFGEEKAIRLMLCQAFTDREKRFYNDKRKANTIKYRTVK